MANDEHVKLLLRGVETWNAWRERNPKEIPDLSGARLTHANLHGAQLTGANLANAQLAGVNLSHTKARGAQLTGANLTDAQLTRADLTDADLTDAQLADANLYCAFLTDAQMTGARLTRADLRRAQMARANMAEAFLSDAQMTASRLTRADLSGAQLAGSNLSMAFLTNARLSGANLSGAQLAGANLTEAILTNARLSGADLRGAQLTRADLTDALLDSASLRDTDMTGAILAGADLVAAVLRGARLAGANLTAASFGQTIFLSTDLSLAFNLDECRHRAPSILDQVTMQRSGRMPLAFLLGCGLPETLITYLPSIFEASPVQFYSVFISYASANEDFAKRLHADLQDKGIRCWFAPHDMRAGKKIHEQIDEAIRVYDRLLLILSQDSMSSAWVKVEIDKARQREIGTKRRVLFPIALVPFDEIRSWEQFNADIGEDSAREIREYHMPDFSCWKVHDVYQREFDRLVEALKNQA